MAELTAAILAGGLGTRLRPLMADRPKVLAQIRGRPFLAYLLDQLVAAGIRYVVLCTGYLSDQIRAEFGDTYSTLNLVYSQEPSPLDTAGALRFALPLFKHGLSEVNVSESVLIMNGDSFCEVDLMAFCAWHQSQGANATLLLTEVSHVTGYGRVHVDVGGRVLRFNEKGDTGGSGWVNAGIYLLNRRLLQTIPTGRAVSLEREMFPAWIDRNMYGYLNKGRFLDIGTPERYAGAERFFALEPQT